MQFLEASRGNRYTTAMLVKHHLATRLVGGSPSLENHAVELVEEDQRHACKDPR